MSKYENYMKYIGKPLPVIKIGKKKLIKEINVAGFSEEKLFFKYKEEWFFAFTSHYDPYLLEGNTTVVSYFTIEKAIADNKRYSYGEAPIVFDCSCKLKDNLIDLLSNIECEYYLQNYILYMKNNK